MSFKSNDFNANATSYVPKIMTPGTVRAKISDIKLDVPPYNKEAYSIVVTLEGEEQGGEFQGLPIDRLNPSLGNYKGQVATVRSGRYPFSDYTFQGKEVKRDQSIFKWINNLANQMGVLEKMNADNVTAETIEEYVEVCKKYLLNTWGMFTIAGTEYFTEGYDKPNYRLFFPKQSGKLLPYSAIESENGWENLLMFNQAEHIIQKVDAPAGEEFNTQPTDSDFPESPSDYVNLELPM
jgi:hypothetical protein